MEIDFLKSKTYTEINEMFNEMKRKVDKAESELNKLNIGVVTQQSEPLVAFMKYYKNNVPIGTQKSSVEIVKDYLATNGW